MKTNGKKKTVLLLGAACFIGTEIVHWLLLRTGAQLPQLLVDFLNLINENRLDVFLAEVSVSFIAITLTSTLSSKEEVVYWQNLIYELLINPPLTSFRSLSDDCFLCLAGSFLCVFLQRPGALTLFLAGNILSLMILAYKMMTIYFQREKIKQRLEVSFEEEAEKKEERIEKLIDNTYLAMSDKNAEVVEENIAFMLKHGLAGKTYKFFQLMDAENEGIFLRIFKTLDESLHDLPTDPMIDLGFTAGMEAFPMDRFPEDIKESARKPQIRVAMDSQKRELERHLENFYLNMLCRTSFEQVLSIFDPSLHSDELRNVFLNYVIDYDNYLTENKVRSYSQYILLRILEHLVRTGNEDALNRIGEYLFERGEGKEIYGQEIGMENGLMFTGHTLTAKPVYRFCNEYPMEYQSTGHALLKAKSDKDLRLSARTEFILHRIAMEMLGKPAPEYQKDRIYLH